MIGISNANAYFQKHLKTICIFLLENFPFLALILNLFFLIFIMKIFFLVN